jgi:tRNA(fMet)-specific endonuclease VapC
MILLDTDTFSLYQFGPPRLVERYRAASEVPALSIVTQIEVLRGRHEAVLKAEDGPHLLRAQQHLLHSIHTLALFQIVPFDQAAADLFDDLRQNKKLKKIGRADLLVACIALAHRATLVSRNLKHFRQVPGLQVENWMD